MVNMSTALRTSQCMLRRYQLQRSYRSGKFVSERTNPWHFVKQRQLYDIALSATDLVTSCVSKLLDDRREHVLQKNFIVRKIRFGDARPDTSIYL